MAQGVSHSPTGMALALALHQAAGATSTASPKPVSKYSAALADGTLTSGFTLVAGGAPWACLSCMLVHTCSTLVSLGTLSMSWARGACRVE